MPVAAAIPAAATTALEIYVLRRALQQHHAHRRRGAGRHRRHAADHPAARSGDAWKIVSCSIYAATLLALYLTSTLYHSLRGRAKDVLRQLDYCAIYLLIAGSYTPFTLVSLRGPWGWTLFGVVWGLAVIGIVQELLFAKARACCPADLRGDGLGRRDRRQPADRRAGLERLYVAGGLVYTLGIAFFVTDHKWRYGHGVWHLFVLGGSACHFGAVLLYVA
jgi:hemolysin III